MLTELQDMQRFLTWRYGGIRKNGKRSKIPYCPRTGRCASVDDAETWCTYAEAESAAGRYDGIGIVLGNGIAGVDIDGCRDPKTGELNDMARAIIDALETYTEISPSGTGIHIIMRVDPVFSWPKQRNDAVGLEIYSAGRYFTLTGNTIGSTPTVNDRTRQLTDVCKRYLPASDGRNTYTPTNTASYQNATQARQMSAGIPADDGELLQRMFNSANGSDIHALYTGDLRQYHGDHSRADLALCNQLAWWTGGDAERIDRMFRCSELMRDKWDSLRGGRTYGALTIDRALTQLQGAYNPQCTAPSPNMSTGGGEAREHNWLTAAVSDIPADTMQSGGGDLQDPPPMLPARPTPTVNDPAADVSPLLGTSRFGGYLTATRDAPKYIVSTGIASIDGMLRVDDALGSGLYPGLYIIGGRTGVGKSTLVGQIADNIAAAGRPVLYVALEMSAIELIAKSVARIAEPMARAGNYIPASYGAILGGLLAPGSTTRRAYDAASASAQYYQSIAPHLYILESIGNTSTAEIVRLTGAITAARGIPPVVIVDYLQLMGRSDPHMSEKQAADANMLGLKQLSRDANIPVIAVSSLNRDSTKHGNNRISQESYKESGGIEYGADVLLGIERTRNEPKGATRHAVQVVMLKNRRGPDAHPSGFMANLATCSYTPDPSCVYMDYETQTACADDAPVY